MSEIDFKGLAHALRYRTRELLPEWLPGGKIVGKEYTCADIHGGQGSSFKVNIESGIWKDFAADQKGGDLISLYATIKGISQIEAARALQSYVGSSYETTRQSKVRPTDERLGPPPPGVGKPVFTHFKFGEPQGIWTYKDSDGSVLFYTARYFNKEENKKEFLPYSWSLASSKWVRKLWPAPRPLYGLDLLAKHPKTAVLVVEGEKACEAARKFINPGTYVVVSWASGASASMLTDWTPLHGRKVLLWPDADLKTYPNDHNVGRSNMGQFKPEHEQPGFIAMQKIAKELVDHCPEVKILKTFQCSRIDGWDAADAYDEGMDWEKFKAWARPRAQIYKKPVEPEVMPNCADAPPPGFNDVPPIEDFTGQVFNPEEHGYYSKGEKGWNPLYSLMAKDVRKAGDHVFDESGGYKYGDGFWSYVSDEYLKSMICSINTAHIQPSHIDNFAKIIRGFNYIKNFNFHSIEHKINVANGILDLQTYELTEHSKEYFFRWKLPVAYDPKAQCPLWMKFLDEVFQGDKTLVDASQLIFGYILMGGRPFFHKAFVLTGSGRNGKGVFIAILRAIIGRENWSNVSINALEKPFSAVMLDGKIANISEETPNDRLSSNTFKEAVGGGYLTMAKKYVDEYPGQVNARFVFACNEMPVFADNTEGCLDRLFFLPFNRYFTEGERDVFLEERIKSKELPGILNWAIQGMKILREMEMPRIEEPVPSLILKEQYKTESDTVYSWMLENLEIGDNLGNESTKNLYASYNSCVLSAGKKPFNKNKFVALLCKHGSLIAKRNGQTKFKNDRYYVLGVQRRGFLGCKLIDNGEND
jgi:P4 family phage/plasmid primase-like protien